eukprot:TRINITY_DN94922_c0_g1_i1.p1 TRINITY_DN94922_c0_g1~~TRINITY_DN94922_c0_g1_i1.p1  ORF type:complete len:539 (-),score=109.80 TRINITY_DN94922_c0_g1_i1:34-1650(-)
MIWAPARADDSMQGRSAGGLVPQAPILTKDGPAVNIVLLGPPAGGKGTQAAYLSDRYGMVHISTGDLLRARAKFLPELADYISSGRLVPDDVVSSVLKERMADRDCAAGVLLDGFPRTRAQAESLRAVGVKISAVVHLEVADEVVIDRIEGRRIDPISGKIYHVKDNPPPPDIAHRVIQREDDTPDKIRTRLVTYHEERDAIIGIYGDLVKTIRVGGTSPDALPSDVRPMLVFDEVRKALEGDTYWGSVLRSEIVAKAYECGSFSTTLVSLAQFFQHSRFRLVQKGCLADAAAKAERVVLRAQVLQLAARLEPMARYQIRSWLEKVGRHSVVIGHAISQNLRSGNVVCVARGSAALVLLDGNHKVMEVPEFERLSELAAPATALRGHEPVNDVKAANPEAMAETIGMMPADCWSRTSCVAAVDLDASGQVHEAACLAYFERWRYCAASESGYPASLNKRILHAHTVRAFVAYAGLATAGDCIVVNSWSFTPSPDAALKESSISLAFEVRKVPGDNSKGSLLLRGCLMLGEAEEPRPRL